MFGLDTLVNVDHYHIDLHSNVDKMKNIEQYHKDYIPRLPKSCHLLGSTSICENQGYIRFTPGSPSALSQTPPLLSDPQVWKDIQIFTVQGHPEFTKRIVDKLVDAREANGVLSKESAQRARERSEWRNDGVTVIGKVIWRILGVQTA